MDKSFKDFIKESIIEGLMIIGLLTAGGIAVILLLKFGTLIF